MDKSDYLSNCLTINFDTFWENYKNKKYTKIINKNHYIPYKQNRYKLFLKIEETLADDTMLNDDKPIKYVLIEICENYNINQIVISLSEENINDDLICYLVSNKYSLIEIEEMCKEIPILKDKYRIGETLEPLDIWWTGALYFSIGYYYYWNEMYHMCLILITQNIEQVKGCIELYNLIK